MAAITQVRTGTDFSKMLNCCGVRGITHSGMGGYRKIIIFRVITVPPLYV